MKIIAFGFKPYMSFFQNQVDLLIVVTSLIMAFLDSMDLEIVKVGTQHHKCAGEHCMLYS